MTPLEIVVLGTVPLTKKLFKQFVVLQSPIIVTDSVASINGEVLGIINWKNSLWLLMFTENKWVKAAYPVKHTFRAAQPLIYYYEFITREVVRERDTNLLRSVVGSDMERYKSAATHFNLTHTVEHWLPPRQYTNHSEDPQLPSYKAEFCQHWQGFLDTYRKDYETLVKSIDAVFSIINEKQQLFYQ